MENSRKKCKLKWPLRYTCISFGLHIIFCMFIRLMIVVCASVEDAHVSSQTESNTNQT